MTFMILCHILDDPNWTTNILNELFELNEEVENSEEDDSTKHFEDSNNIMSGIEKMVVSNISDAEMPGHCRAELWSCLSSLMERGIKHVRSPGDIVR